MTNFEFYKTERKAWQAYLPYHDRLFDRDSTDESRVVTLEHFVKWLYRKHTRKAWEK